ncbi:MAG: hypothetical protein LC649_00270 [Bacteroidales bacterium]|nr:hypothetical protein [Bacteroidales bacterium]
MKRVFPALFAALLIFHGCTREKQTPDGPTDIRVRNITEADFLSVTVNTGEEEYLFGDVAAHSETGYYRFEIAYPDAEVTFTFNGNLYTTGVPDNTYAVPLQQGKFTYEIWISDDPNRVIATRVIADAPLGE